MKGFYELFIIGLKEAYSCENQLVKAIPKMIKHATSSKLKEALQHHLKETKQQVKRLEQIAEELNESLSGPKNAVVFNLIKEGSRVAKYHFDPLVKDSALIGCAQQIEHYEIATYGFLKSCAKHLHLKQIESWLDESSHEEGGANKRLTEIAEGNLFREGINTQAYERCPSETLKRKVG